LTVFELVVDTIFICFCVDCEQNDGMTRPFFMSRKMMEVMIELKGAAGGNFDFNRNNPGGEAGQPLQPINQSYPNEEANQQFQPMNQPYQDKEAGQPLQQFQPMDQPYSGKEAGQPINQSVPVGWKFDNNQ
jgi:hypothetical protein